MALDFDKFAAKGNEFLNLVAERLGVPGEKEMAGRIVRSVFHVLRKQITVEESFELIAQLPMMLKAVYVDGWKLSEAERHRTVESFTQAVMFADGAAVQKDFPDDETAKDAIAVVFSVLAQYVSEGELKDIAAVLPKELKAFLRNTAHLRD